MNGNDSLLDLNSADRKLLTQLPGVTKNLAYRIVNYRHQHGGFRDWSTVQTTVAFSKPQMERLKERAFLGPRPAPLSEERHVISRWKGKPDDEQHAHG